MLKIFPMQMLQLVIGSAWLVVLSLCLGLGEEASAQSKAKGRAGVTREKHISREKTMKSRDTTKLDFDAADIGGNRKAPMGSFLNQNKADKEYDFVKIRLRWVPEMVQSSASLDSGKSR